MRAFVSLKRVKFDYCVTLFIFLYLMFTSLCWYLLKMGNGMTLIWFISVQAGSLIVIKKIWSKNFICL